jgi:hypothetical protein
MDCQVGEKGQAMSDALDTIRDKTTKRLLRYLVAGSFFMIAGAAVYASQTESLDYCKAVFDAELLPYN